VVRAGLEPATNGLQMIDSRWDAKIRVFSCAPNGFASDNSEFDGPIPVTSQALAVNKR